ncbi:MAG: sulfatase [Myxococcota bacterium]
MHAVLVAALLGCAASEAERPDIVLISVDTLRADRIGSYGAGRDTSPHIDQFAAEGARFSNVLAPTSWTLPSHVSLLTGMDILVHRVIEPSDRIDPHRRTLGQELAARGYHTAGFVSAPYLHAAYGFDRGFGRYENFGVPDVVELPPSTSIHDASHADETAPVVIDAAIAWLQGPGAADGRPIFLFVHLWDPHYDYVPPAPYDRIFDTTYRGKLDVRSYEKRIEINAAMPVRDLQHLRALYDGEVRWTDSQIARLTEALRSRGRLDRTVLSIVSDHGEEFFEHGRRGHKRTLFEESVRVPWILRYPPAVSPGTVIASTVSLADVAPTLLDLAGFPSLAEATGRSLAPELSGSERPDRPVLLHVNQLFALRGAGWKVVAGGGQPLFYDLRRDPGEMAPQPAEDAAPKRLAELHRRIAAERSAAAALVWDRPRDVKLDDATRARLRELGYLDE